MKIKPTCKFHFYSRFQNIDLFAKQNSYHSLDKTQQPTYPHDKMSSKIE